MKPLLYLLFFLFVRFTPGYAQENLYDKDLLTKNFHKLRREALRKQMPPNTVAIFFSAPIRIKSNDVDYTYHQDPDFYYLTGLREPNSILLVFKEETQVGKSKNKEFIFVQDRDPKSELWNGRRYGKEGVEKELGFSSVFLNTEIGTLLNDFSKLKVLITNLPSGMVDILGDKAELFDMVKYISELIKYPNGNIDKETLYSILADLRQEKQTEELNLLRNAIDMTCQGIKELMKAMSPEMTEYQSQAIVEYFFKKNGSEEPGFPSIVGGGENSCILHYESNRKKLESKDLLVCDVGAEYHGYSADVTRTLPVNGKFNAEQKLIYNLVLTAQEEGIKQCKPGNNFFDPGKTASKIISKGLKELGIIKNEEDYKKYFPHGTSHYLGLDVHDIGKYEQLKIGDVITVEPGIYIPEGSDCEKKWWNIGVRLEDDILITEKGHEVLSSCVPKKIEEVEALMKEKSNFK
jgi:Xaa-Pro aminopeptidase